VKDLDAARKKLRPAVRAMVEFMLLVGCRPNEVCQLRGRDLDRTKHDCWLFRPAHHKTDSYGHERIVLIGPKAQKVLRPYLAGIGPDDWVFSPRREEEKRNAKRHLDRKAPMSRSAEARMERARTVERKRPPKERYTTSSLRRAIDRACRLAGVPVFGPNRLRHTRATQLRPHGLDVVGTILGHAKLETTQIYSQKNLAAAIKLVGKVG
jgi:integrase